MYKLNSIEELTLPHVFYDDIYDNLAKDLSKKEYIFSVVLLSYDKYDYWYLGLLKEVHTEVNKIQKSTSFTPSKENLNTIKEKNLTLYVPI